MRPVFLAGALAACTTVGGPASATGTITCQGPQASVALGIGSLPVLVIVGARIEAQGEVWSLEGAQGGTPVVVGQAARTHFSTIVDFTDPNLLEVVAELRLIRASEGGHTVEVGTLRLPGSGVHALVCQGP